MTYESKDTLHKGLAAVGRWKVSQADLWPASVRQLLCSYDPVLVVLWIESVSIVKRKQQQPWACNSLESHAECLGQNRRIYPRPPPPKKQPTQISFNKPGSVKDMENGMPSPLETQAQSLFCSSLPKVSWTGHQVQTGDFLIHKNRRHWGTSTGFSLKWWHFPFEIPSLLRLSWCPLF